MPATTSAPIRFGALCWNQYSDWDSLRDAGVRADDVGFDSLWTWDHVYPIVGSHLGPMFEGWLTITAWAALTKRATVGLMVGANTFREPSLVAKMATTLDHISGGRAYLGIGAAWFETEHVAFGFPFGSGAPERLRWLGEALAVMRGMLHGEEPSAASIRYRARNVHNDPLPVQRTLPLLIGGSGEQVTLRLVAQYADANNVGGTLDSVRRKEQVLLGHCERVGRDPAEIERTTGRGVAIIRDSRAEAQRILERAFERNGGAGPWADQPVGTPEDVAEKLAPFVELGYRHMIFGFPHPYDEETMTRLIREVKPALERMTR
jgi:alkanesulfonate monooxygenase SsuD/methylene tetrahydromethanopterin reductase-like flavin-dependent oxidoreductase (luciferase family)